MIAKKAISILLIEATPEEADKTIGLLTRGNDQFKIYPADSLYEAFRLASRRTLDVIVLELNLLESSGYKTFQRCREKLPHLPLVIHTQQNNEIIGIQAIRAGAQDYLIKGQADPRHLQRAIYFATQRHELITQLDQENQTLQQKERKLRDVQAVGGFGSWEMNILNQEISGSPNFYTLLGLNPSDSTIKKDLLLDLVHPADKEKALDFFSSLIQSNTPQSCRLRMVQNGTRIVHFELTARLQIDESAQQVIALGTLNEVIEEAEIIQLRREQQYSRTLINLRDQVLQDISFHIRTPLYSIVNFLYLLEESPFKVQFKEAFNGLKFSVDELQQHINQLITFSLAAEEQPHQQIKTFDLRQSLDLVSKMLDFGKSRQSVWMDIKTDQLLPHEVQGDQNKLIQVFYNLFDLFTLLNPEPRKVAVRVKAETTDPDWFNLVIQCRDPLASSTAVQLQDWRNESLLNGTDQDTPEQEHLARINLYTLDKMIRSMSGTLQMPDGQHLALKMVISLPMKLAVVTDVPAPIQDWIEPLRILLVEDHFLNQIATKNVLQTWSPDLTVDIAENGLVAVEKFQAHEYDLVLMDIQMPVMNGLIAGKKIRELSNVPIIALSAYASEQEAEKCLRAGFSDYLAKPFKPEELKHKVFRLASLVR